ncbi:ligand-binding sensor domain-containing protein [Paucibacter oligotrophus]|uniref:histidine kinase n=1 Tax=Roseateles oligotrophus TaxID=1769250 RepID=A0A840LBD7_9BURK|nr:two-component regulator propeller domain-containing protein [Roseateles oligotrophus]MBB4844013.1 ligand-binding sensor domain-containing protein [Roseateles oligotrophus]
MFFAFLKLRLPQCCAGVALFAALLIVLPVQAGLPAGLPATRSLHFERLNETQGLLRDSITRIEQDSHGFVWIAGQAGLSRFDGRRVLNYRHEPGRERGLADGWVQALQADEMGRLWVGTRKGLQRYLPASDDFETLAIPHPGPGSLQVHSLLADGRAGLWIGTDQGLYRLDTASRRFQRFAGADEQPGDAVTALFQDRQGLLWVGRETGLALLRPGSQQLQTLPMPDARQALGARAAKGLLLDEQGCLWVAGQAGLQVWQLEGRQQVGRRLLFSPRHSNDSFILPFLDRSGRVWVSTETEGLWLWQPQQQRFQVFPHRPGDEHSVPRHISTLMQDRSGTLWLGTWASGSYRVDLASGGFKRISNLRSQSGELMDNRIFSIASLQPGWLWLSGYDNAAELELASGRLRVHRFGSNELESLNIADARVAVNDASAQAWLRRYTDTRTGRLRLPRFGGGSLESDVIRHVSSDAAGGIWLSSLAGLHHLAPDGRGKTSYRHDPARPGSLSDDLVKMVLVARDGQVWVATDGGLDRFNPASGDFTHFRSQAGRAGSLSSDRIHYLHEDRRGRIWVGTAQGLNQLHREAGGVVRFSRPALGEGLDTAPIGGILEDEQGRLWVSTTAGVSRYSPDSQELHNYTSVDGLIEGFHFASSAFKDAEGRMYFGGLNGLTAFHPGEIRDNPHAPQLALTEIRLNNEVLRPDEWVQDVKLASGLAELRELQLSHLHESLSLEFAALHFADPQRNRYAYQLEGFDKDWVQAGQPRASYTNLPAGRYVFRVKAANKDGVWNEQGLSLHIEVAAPYWQTWWFRLSLGLVLLFSVFALIRARLAMLTEQKRRLEAQVLLRTAELREQKQEVERQKAIVEQTQEELLRQRKFAALGGLVAGVAHELNTPLGNCLMAASTLEDRASAMDGRLSQAGGGLRRSELSQFVGDVRLAAQLLMRGLQRSGELLSRFKQVAVARQGQPRQCFSLRGLAEDLRASLYKELHSLGHELVLDIPEHLLLESYPEPLIELLQQLISNSLLHGFEGRRGGRMLLQARPHGEQALRLVYRDDGLGIAPELIARIFDPFFTTKLGQGGSGLGLSICYNLLHAVLGGEISVESEAGQGVCFIIELPLQAP